MWCKYFLQFDNSTKTKKCTSNPQKYKKNYAAWRKSLVWSLQNESHKDGADLPKLLWKSGKKAKVIQVNLFQKHLILHQLTHNMTKDCSLIYQFSTWKLQAQNMLCAQIGFCFDIQNNSCTQHVLPVFWACSFHVLNW